VPAFGRAGREGAQNVRKRINSDWKRERTFMRGPRKFCAKPRAGRFPPGKDARRHTAAPPANGHFDFGVQDENALT